MGALQGRPRRDRGRLKGGAISPIVSEEIERYAEEHTTPHPELLQRLAEETKATLDRPQMLTGTIEGRFLEFIVYMTGARRILELGTYSGYSAISMAAALPAGGRIDTCEMEEEHAAVARRYVEEAGYTDRITIHLHRHLRRDLRHEQRRVSL